MFCDVSSGASSGLASSRARARFVSFMRNVGNLAFLSSVDIPDVFFENERERRTSDQKKYFNSSELGVLSTTVNSNLGSVDTGTVGAVREEQKQDFDQNQDSVPRYS